MAFLPYFPIAPLVSTIVLFVLRHAHTHLGGQVTEGVHGVLFLRKLFDDALQRPEAFSDHCRLHDDLWVSAHLARKAVQREVLVSRVGSTALPYGFGPVPGR